MPDAIIDGHGSGNKLAVLSDGSIRVGAITGLYLQAIYSATGANCTGNDGDPNRTLTINNTKLSSNEQVVVQGLTLALTTDYTIVHSATNSVVTFINPIFDSQWIDVRYFYTS